jgi:hypothetical protein
LVSTQRSKLKSEGSSLHLAKDLAAVIPPHLGHRFQVYMHQAQLLQYQACALSPTARALSVLSNTVSPSSFAALNSFSPATPPRK